MIFLTLKLIRKTVIALSLLAGAALLADGSWIYAKAQLAQRLIDHAWTQTLATGAAVKPWPWADTWPVARLEAQAQHVDLLVLQGTHGSALAFGPGWLIGSALPGTAGTTIIAGHRDTHFRFMAQIAAGDRLTLTDNNGLQHHYRVAELAIVDSRQQELVARADSKQLLLVTCYPFTAIAAGGPLRYVVKATAETVGRRM